MYVRIHSNEKGKFFFFIIAKPSFYDYHRAEENLLPWASGRSSYACTTAGTLHLDSFSTRSGNGLVRHLTDEHRHFPVSSAKDLRSTAFKQRDSLDEDRPYILWHVIDP